MSEHTLPSDPQDWPADPYALLGVAPNVDERSLKRAYVALIRRFNPEHAPDEFHRIRTAYEKVREQLRWRSVDEEFTNSASPQHFSMDDEDQPALERAVEAPVDRPRNTEEPDVLSPITKSTAQTLPAALDASWAQATVGNWEEARTMLRALQQRYPANEEVLLRLYWVQSLGWGPDAEPQPREVLFAFVQRQGLRGRLGALYLRELETVPAQLLSAETAALTIHAGSRELLVPLIKARWQQAAAQDDWQLLQFDLQDLEAPLIDTPWLWSSLQLLVLELAFASVDPIARTLVANCQRHFTEELGAAKENRYLLDQADHWFWRIRDTENILAIPHRPQRVSPSLLDVILNLRTGSFLERRERLQPVLRAWIVDPRKALQELDEAWEHAPALLLELLQALEAILSQREQDLNVNEVQLLNSLTQSDIFETQRFRRLQITKDLRHKLLESSLTECVTWDQLQQALAHFPHIAGTKLQLRSLAGDTPLKCITTGCLVFWASE